MAYTKIRELGRGGFGKVDLVEDQNGDFWARKTLVDPGVPDISQHELLKRFKREVRYQGQISHPNVVNIVDHDLTDNPPWFVMPLAEGSLWDELSTDRSLGGDPKKALFDILSGLEALHEHGVVHRDLKPLNVLKYNDGDGSIRYAVSDFGLVSSAESESSSLTASHMGMGTPYYAPPECANDFKRATFQSDIYSFGAILHDIFGNRNQRVPHAELTGPGPIGQVITTCTKKLPARRFASVNELRDAVFQALEGHEYEFVSGEEEEVVSLLKKEDELTEDQWDQIVIYIEDNAENPCRNLGGVFRYLSAQHLDELADSAPQIFASVGHIFAEYVEQCSFNFDYCDVLAGKMEKVFSRAQIDLKARVIRALMEMGISHNRWLVMRKFMQLAGPELDDSVARRFVLDIEAEEIPFEQKMRRIESIIHTTRGRLHPRLQQALGGIR
jgi:serine/threonine protein kinase